MKISVEDFTFLRYQIIPLVSSENKHALQSDRDTACTYTSTFSGIPRVYHFLHQVNSCENLIEM